MFAAIEQMAICDAFAVSAICEVLSVSRSGFYSWQFRGLSARDERDEELMPMIRDIFWRHRRRYGARRIAMDLADRGELCGVAVPERVLVVKWFPEVLCAHRPRHKPGLVFAALGLAILFVRDCFCFGCRESDLRVRSQTFF